MTFEFDSHLDNLMDSGALGNASKVMDSGALGNASKVMDNAPLDQNAIYQEIIIRSFFKGMSQAIPVEDLEKFKNTMASPYNFLQFQGGHAVGLLEGLIGGVSATITGLWDIVVLAVRINGIVLNPRTLVTMVEIAARLPYNDINLNQILVLAKDLGIEKELSSLILLFQNIESIRPLIAQILSTPENIAMFLDLVSSVFGSLVGEQIKDFLQKKPYDQGKLIGTILGRSVYELVLLLVPGEELLALFEKSVDSLKLGKVLKEVPEIVTWLTKIIEQRGFFPPNLNLAGELYRVPFLKRAEGLYSLLSTETKSFKELKKLTSLWNEYVRKLFPGDYESLALDAHHIIESRFFEIYADVFKKLGIASEAEMPCMAVHYSSHRLSPRNMIIYDKPTTWKSIIEFFFPHIKDLGRPVSVEGMSLTKELMAEIPSSSNLTFEELLNAYQNFYRKTAWSEKLEAFFLKIRNDLGLPPFPLK